MQNANGGWGAFDRNIENEILERVPFADHNAMLDPACPDITARVLESLSHYGYRVGQKPVDRAVAFVKEYDRYPDPDRFGGMIVRAKVNAASGDRYDVSMRTTMTKVITVVLDYDYDITYERRSPTRLTSTSVARRIHQIESAGKPSERRRPVDEIDAFMWRLRTYCWFDERPEGAPGPDIGGHGLGLRLLVSANGLALLVLGLLPQSLMTLCFVAISSLWAT